MCVPRPVLVLPVVSTPFVRSSSVYNSNSVTDDPTVPAVILIKNVLCVSISSPISPSIVFTVIFAPSSMAEGFIVSFTGLDAVTADEVIENVFEALHDPFSLSVPPVILTLVFTSGI